MNTKSFNCFTTYFLFLQNLLTEGYVHTNETFWRIPKNSKTVTTTKAGSTCITICYN